MSAHTPGPLVARGSDVIGVPRSSPVNIKVRIADCYGSVGIAASERNANAKLFAAAPQMLEALKNIENDDEHMPESAWRLIQDAIKLAEGK